MYFNRRKWILICIPTIIIMILIIFFIVKSVPSEEEYETWEQTVASAAAVEEPIVEQEQKEVVQEVTTIFVDVKGEVLSPGVYEVNGESRVQDLIKLAGGFTSLADRNGVNLAQRVQDEMVIYVPALGESQSVWTDKGNQSNSSALININVAEQAELETLPGIGPSKAAAIIAYREENGSFKTIEDLGLVSGIGDKSLEKLREYITTH
nr:helix-hairpin-helix domain-containing protein [Bacillus mesophilus]